MSKFEYEEKFVVLNKKHFDELIEAAQDKAPACAVVQNTINTIQTFSSVYQAVTKKSHNNKYYVVNQDEPYADQIRDIIEHHENLKLKSEEEE